MPTDNDLPLAGNKQSLNIWLNSLSQLGSHRASNKLYEMLQVIYQESFGTQDKLELLNQLAAPVITYSDQLEQIVVAQQCFKNEALVRKTTTLSCELLRLLSLNYCKVSLAEDLNSEQHAVTIYTALHVIGLSLCKRAVLNQVPSETLWKKTAELYQRAQKYQLLNHPITLTALFTSQQSTIAKILQRNLLFVLCDPYHFSNQSIKALFSFAETASTLLEIDASAQTANFVWPYKKQTVPHACFKSEAPSPHTLYLSCAAVTELLKLQNPLNFNKSELDHLLQHLSSYADIIESAIPSEATACKLIVDYQQLHIYLNHHATIQNIYRASTPSGKPIARSNSLQLVPLNAQVQTPKQKAISDASNNPFSMPAVSVHPTRYKNYFVAMTSNPALQIDLPILFVDKSEHIKLGFIKQIARHQVTLSHQILIEHIPGTAESINITLDGQSTLAILITKATDEREIVLPAVTVQSGGQFEINSRKFQGIFFLAELLQFTSHYRHFRISPD
ncbi:MAG: hypothetical protein ABL903_06745 [Methylococcales bacterium]